MMGTSRLPVVDWTDALADLNGLVRFAERRNLVSAHVPSHFKRSLAQTHWCYVCQYDDFQIISSFILPPSVNPFFLLSYFLSLTYLFSSLFLTLTIRIFSHMYLIILLHLLRLIILTVSLIFFCTYPWSQRQITFPYQRFKIVSHLFRRLPSMELLIANPIFYMTYISRIHMEMLCLLQVCLCFRNEYSYDNMRHSSILTLQAISYDIAVFHCTVL
jgi:hypothetical protein